MFKNLFKKKEKYDKDHFKFVIYDQNMNIVAGVNNKELAKDICNIVAHSSSDTFYITGNNSVTVYCLEIEQKRELYETLDEIQRTMGAPYIPGENL